MNMLFFLLAAITVTTSFEGGSLGRVEQIVPGHLRCAVKGQADQNNRNRQANWYYFRLDNLPRREITIDLTDLVGEYNFRSGTHAVTRDTRPVFSYDDRIWTHFSDEQTSWDDQAVRLTVRFTPERSTMWIAHTYPYTNRDLQRLVAGRSPYLSLGSVGKSVDVRNIPLVTITDATVPDRGKKVVWLMARQHAWESGTSLVAEGAIRFLISNDPEAARIRRSAIFRVIPIFDVDGAADGAVRFNRNGYDNNRNWDAIDPKLMPEIASVRESIFGWLDAGHPIDVFLAMHNTESGDYVEGPVAAGGARVRAIADVLVNSLRAQTDFYDPRSPRDSMGSQPIAKGRVMVDQDLFAERKIPAFLMELMIERHPKLERLRTSQDFIDFGAGLAKSLAAAVEAASK